MTEENHQDDFFSPPPLEEGWRKAPEELSANNSIIFISPVIREYSFILIRVIGYGLLILGFIDALHLLIPPNFFNPLWEFQTIGQFVERLPVPFLGFLFVFFCQGESISNRELRVFQFLSWIALLLGIIYLLMIPLCLRDGWRIYNVYKAQLSQINTQATQQIEQQIKPFQQFQSQLNEVETNQEIKNLLLSLSQQGSLPNIENPQKVKEQILTKITETQENIKTNITNQATAQRQQIEGNIQLLIKNSVKWNLGALVGGVWFMLIWYLTRWTRDKNL